MPRASDHEIEESYDRVYGTPDDEDDALLDHVMWPDGKPKQGLHARPERWEDDAVDDHFYGGWTGELDW